MYRRIANWLLMNSEDKGYNVDILAYGLEVIGVTWGKTLILLLLGICTGYLMETAIILLVFCGLRSQAGGRHCKTSWGCSLTMISIIYGSILFGKMVKLSDLFIMICLAVYVLIVYNEAPYCTANHPISDKLIINQRKRNSVFILFLIMAAETVVQNWQTRGIIFFACSIEVLSMVSLKKVWKIGGIHNE